MAFSLPKIEMPSWLRLPTPSVRAGAAGGKLSMLEAKVPPVAFDLDQTSLAMVRLGRRKLERYIASYGVLELPPETVEIDFYNVHLKSPEKFRELVRRMVEKEDLKLDKVSFLLPDNYARVAIITLDQLPRRRQDALELVKWKTKKAVPFKVEEAAIDYMVLPGPGPKVDLLAVLIPRAVVEGFESAFHALEIQAGLVDLSTLSLLNLYRPVLEREIVNGSEFMVANVSGGFVTFVIFRGQQMIFFRSKPFAPGSGDDEGRGALRLIRRELQTSLLYYREKLQGRELARAYLRVVELGPESVASLFTEQPEIAEVDWIDPRKVLEVDERMTGEQGTRLLQRLAPALGATLGREAA